MARRFAVRRGGPALGSEGAGDSGEWRNSTSPWRALEIGGPEAAPFVARADLRGAVVGSFRDPRRRAAPAVGRRDRPRGRRGARMTPEGSALICGAYRGVSFGPSRVPEIQAPMSSRILMVVLALVLAPIAAGLHYVLPRHDVVRIVNTEVRRVDASGKPISGGERPGSSRDVYYIYAEDPESRDPHVYRNEDTGWGFPFYFKFNSADEQAVAASISGEKGTALITKYGWRLQLFSWFPNAVNVRRWEPGQSVIPWFNIVFFSGAALLIGYLLIRIRRART